MCIVAFYFHDETKELVVAANRDEFYARPSAPLHSWQHNGVTIYGGRDLKEHGTWLGVNEMGHFVAITNYRNPQLEKPTPRSRGHIATDFLTQTESAQQFAKTLQQHCADFGPFNVLLYDGEQLIHYNNIVDELTVVPTGVHVLCNATLNTPWPKVERLRQSFTNTLPDWTPKKLIQVLQDERKAPVAELPATGVPFELEFALSSIFIRLPHYGTRCSTVCHIHGSNISLYEQSYANGEATSIAHIDLSKMP